MRHTQINLLIIIVVFFISSCGIVIDDDGNRGNRHRPFYEGKGFEECLKANIPELQFANIILEYYGYLSDRFNSLNRTHFELSSYYRNSRVWKSFVFTPLRPLRLSKKRLNYKLDQIRGKLGGIPAKDALENDEMILFADEYAEMANLRESARRYKRNYCKKSALAEDQKHDVLPYIDASGWEEYFPRNDEGFFEYARNELSSFHYGNLFQAAFNRVRIDLDCKKAGDHFEIQIYLYEPNQGKRNQIKSAIESYWKSEKGYFRVYNASDPYAGVLRVKSINSSASYVERARPNVINLGSRTPEYRKARVIAHEFGHIIGFPDCYLEHYNEHLDEFIYYELSGSNLMCSINDLYRQSVPSNYINQAIKRYCRL